MIGTKTVLGNGNVILRMTKDQYNNLSQNIIK